LRSSSRVATVVEGVCVTLDEDFDFISTATDYLTEEGYREESIRQYIDETGRQLRRSGESLTRLAPKAERALDRLDRDDLYVRIGVEDKESVFDKLAKRLVYGMLLTMSLFSMGVLYALEAPCGSIVAAVFGARRNPALPVVSLAEIDRHPAAVHATEPAPASRRGIIAASFVGRNCSVLRRT